MLIIGIMGVKHSGKDTAYEVLWDSIKNRVVHHVAFAKPIKYASLSLCLFNDRQMTIPWLKETVDDRYGFAPRDVWEAIGKAMRQLREDFFHIRLKHEIDEMTKYMSDEKKSKQVFIITDVRYPDEVEFIHNTLGGKVIGISREGTEATTDSDKQVNLDLADYRVDNNGTKEEYQDKLLEILKDLL